MNVYLYGTCLSADERTDRYFRWMKVRGVRSTFASAQAAAARNDEDGPDGDGEWSYVEEVRADTGHRRIWRLVDDGEWREVGPEGSPLPPPGPSRFIGV